MPLVETRIIRWYEQFLEEWVARFGCLVTDHEPDSIEAIDEVATIITEQRDCTERHCDALEAALKRARPLVARSNDTKLLALIDELISP